MPAVQLPLGLSQLHTNQQLFSDYYLDQILPERADWKLLADEATSVLAKIRAIYTGFTPSSIEAQTEDDLIKPVLAALGHTLCAALLKPSVRGQDMARWEADYEQLWLIVMKSSSDHPWPWAAAPGEAEQLFAQTYPSLYRHLKPFEEKLRKRQDKGTYWWELRSCAYYDRFTQPKIFYPDKKTPTL